MRVADYVSGASTSPIVADQKPGAAALVDVVYDPAKVRQDYARQFISAANQASNKAHVVSFLQSNYGVSEKDLASRDVRVRILWGTTVFGHSGRRLTAEEHYGVQLEKRGASGAYTSVAPSFLATVNWTRNPEGNVIGFEMRLSKA